MAGKGKKKASKGKGSGGKGGGGSSDDLDAILAELGAAQTVLCAEEVIIARPAARTCSTV
jgi:hypothetical protein